MAKQTRIKKAPAKGAVIDPDVLAQGILGSVNKLIDTKLQSIQDEKDELTKAIDEGKAKIAKRLGESGVSLVTYRQNGKARTVNRDALTIKTLNALDKGKDPFNF